MNTTLDSVAAAYIEAVREALADQPDDEVAEVIDDLTEHLAQIAAEFDHDPSQPELEARLGTPAEYAAELRTAAGLSEPGVPDRPRGRRRMAILGFVVTWLIRLGAAFAVIAGLVMLADGRPDEAAGAYLFGLLPIGAGLLLWFVGNRSTDFIASVRQLPDYPRVEQGIAALRARPWGSAGVEFVVSLRPAWWLLRAWVVTQALIFAAGMEPEFPFDASPVGMVLLAGAIVASVWWGRRSVAGLPAGWPRRSSFLGNLGLAAAAPVVILLMSPGNAYGEPEYYYDEIYVPQTEGFYHEDGSEIINLYVYDQDGQLVEGARLFDQDGRPVGNVAPWKWHECLDEGGYYPDGLQGNVFPRPAVFYDEVEARCVAAGVEAPFGLALPGTALADTEVDGEPEAVATVNPAADLSVATYNAEELDLPNDEVLVGTLAEDGGCLVVDDGSQLWIPVFAAHEIAVGNGALAVNGIPLEIGHQVEFVGGQHAVDDRVNLPGNCQAIPWLVSEVVPTR